VTYSAADLLVRLNLNFDDSRAIELFELDGGHHCFRYYDGQDQRVVTLELDADFRVLGEMGTRSPEHNGDDDYFPQHCGH
jgi:hypothetical protein